jgi:hypothetical protein
VDSVCGGRGAHAEGAWPRTPRCAGRGRGDGVRLRSGRRLTGAKDDVVLRSKGRQGRSGDVAVIVNRESGSRTMRGLSWDDADRGEASTARDALRRRRDTGESRKGDVESATT